MEQEVAAHLADLWKRIESTKYGDIGIVFTMKNGKVELIKEINQPLYRPGDKLGNT